MQAEELLRRNLSALRDYCRHHAGELPEEDWLLCITQQLYQADLQIRGADYMKARLLADQFVYGRPNYPPLDPKDL